MKCTKVLESTHLKQLFSDLRAKPFFSYNTSWAVRYLLKRKHARIVHAISNFHYKHGELKNAWHFHLQNLKHWMGWKYLSFTFPLLKASLSSNRKEQQAPAEKRVPVHTKLQ